MGTLIKKHYGGGNMLDILMSVLEFFNKYIFGVGVPLVLMLSGLYYCIRLRFFHFLHPLKLLRALRPTEKKKGVSSAKALTLALAGTLGVGNMVGVASAIVLGGFGAVFWMWISALVAMILKYAEIVLAMRYRKYDAEGRPHGAAMYYIRKCFRGRLGIALAGIFALFCLLNAFSMGSMIQVNASASAMSGVFGLPQIVIGIVFSLITLFAMYKGRSGILTLTEKLVPFMTGGFVILSLAVIFIRPSAALSALKSIFSDAFSLRSGAAGVFGFLLSGALRYGTMRGILSNEAGCGTAPAAHAVSDCDIPAKQGVWGILEVFVDTILLCTLTAIVIIIGFDSVDTSGDYMMITLDAYRASLGDAAGYFIAVAVLLFGLATVLCWAHYGMESVEYFSRRKGVKRGFIFLYTLSVLLGSVASTELIWEAADLFIGAMTFINLSAVVLMSREVREETDRLL